MLDADFIDSFLGNAHRCTGEMLSNAVYIRKEIANVDLPPGMKEPVADLCDDLIGTRYDVNTEAHELAAILANNNNDRRVPTRIERICRWLDEPILAMHRVVEELKRAANLDGRYSLACLLIAESATNILNARNAMPSPEDQPSFEPKAETGVGKK